MTPLTIKQYVITAKNFIEYNDVDVSPLKFKLKVKMRRAPKSKKQALSKEDIIKILNSCTNIRLKTYVMLLASTGMRAQESLTIRIKDIDFESRRLILRGDNTKTKIERTVLLAEEIAEQLKRWLDYKYRTRRTRFYDKSIKKMSDKYITPTKGDNDLVFSVQARTEPYSIYTLLCKDFDRTLDRMGMGSREESNKRRRITFHSFRRFTKSTISDLGYSDFSEYFIGHSGSTYYTKTDKQITEIFGKVEPHLTFLDYASLERKGADVQSRIDILEQENVRLRHRGKLSDNELRILSEEQRKLEEQIKRDSQSTHRLEQLLIRMMKLHPVSPELSERLEEYIKSRNEE